MLDDSIDLNNLTELFRTVKQHAVKGLLYFSILTNTKKPGKPAADAKGR